MSLWSGRFTEDTDALVAQFTRSIDIDRKLFRHDILGSQAYAKALARAGIITRAECKRLVEELTRITGDIDAGRIDLDHYEDIHMAVEQILIDRLGQPGEKLHTARSRNDQVAVDERLYVRDAITHTASDIRTLQRVLLTHAEAHRRTSMPGYTHLQYAQPVRLAHHLLAYFWMLNRDYERLQDCLQRVNVLPLGSGALAGTSLPLDREYLAKLLGFAALSENSMDAVSDRDYCIETVSCLALIMMHLSRLAEDIILWASPAFAYVDIADRAATGSSLMPQKKNPDIAELIRGKSGRVYGALLSLLVTLKGLPLTYNRDLQEDKFPLFGALEEAQACLKGMAHLLDALTIRIPRMKEAAEEGYFAATDLVEYLVTKGVPFRQAHHLVGRLVRYCVERDLRLQEVPLEDYRRFSPHFDSDVITRVSLQASVSGKNSIGGTGDVSMDQQLIRAREALGSTS